MGAVLAVEVGFVADTWAVVVGVQVAPVVELDTAVGIASAGAVEHCDISRAMKVVASQVDRWVAEREWPEDLVLEGEAPEFEALARHSNMLQWGSSLLGRAGIVWQAETDTVAMNFFYPVVEPVRGAADIQVQEFAVGAGHCICCRTVVHTANLVVKADFHRLQLEWLRAY